MISGGSSWDLCGTPTPVDVRARPHVTQSRAPLRRLWYFGQGSGCRPGSGTEEKAVSASGTTGGTKHNPPDIGDGTMRQTQGESKPRIRGRNPAIQSQTSNQTKGARERATYEQRVTPRPRHEVLDRHRRTPLGLLDRRPPPRLSAPPPTPSASWTDTEGLCYHKNKDQWTLSSHFLTHRINPTRGKRAEWGGGVVVAGHNTNLLCLGKDKTPFVLGILISASCFILSLTCGSGSLSARADVGLVPRPRVNITNIYASIYFCPPPTGKLNYLDSAS